MRFARELRMSLDVVMGTPGTPPITSRSRQPAVATDDRAGEEANRRYWNRLVARHPVGESYLAQRCLLRVLNRDVVRFDRGGWICQPIRSWDDGRVVNVARRRPADGPGPKVLFLCGHTRGCLGEVGHLGETHGPVFITEGWADYLTALQLCTDELVLGALSADAVPSLVARISAAVSTRGLVIVSHPDSAGAKATTAAVSKAIYRGVPATRIHVFRPVTGDLNDSFRRGGS